MIKRLFDITASAIALVVLSPLLFLISLLVRLQLGNPILFRQARPGLKGRIFELYKFRTMKNLTDEFENLLPDAQRMTGVGTALRRWSLDELPELWNVLRGEMSFVGPRPLLMEYVPLYSKKQLRRHDVKPGLTGWAQINGRNAITWEEKFTLDIWYVDNQSLWLDLKILSLTLIRVVQGRGINQSDSMTMAPFKGSNLE